MSGLDELRRKLQPLFDAEKGPCSSIAAASASSDLASSCLVSDGGSLNLLSQSFGVYNVNELGFRKSSAAFSDEVDLNETTYHCASNEMHIFDSIGHGASSVVQRAIYLPCHRVIALKKINIFEKGKRQQLLNEIKTLCEVSRSPGLVEFHGAFFTPNSGQISIALEYVDGGALSDVLKAKSCIPESILSHMVKKLLQGLCFLHGTRHLVHRDIKPANLLVNLNGDAKVTDFGLSAGLDNSMAMCATFVGTVTYMSPERIRNGNYSYPADIWSLGITILECATGKFPYKANDAPANLMLQILYDPSPTPSKDSFSLEFCSFIDACLQKDPDARLTADQLLCHPFIKKYENDTVDLAAYMRGIVNPTERLKNLADMLAVHYYLLFDGSDNLWHHMRTFYTDHSTFCFLGQLHVGQANIFRTLSDIRKKLVGDTPFEKIVHVVEKLQCRVHWQHGLVIRVSGSFVTGNHFLICGTGIKAEGMLTVEELALDITSKRVGSFREQFTMEPGSTTGCYIIANQNLYITQG